MKAKYLQLFAWGSSALAVLIAIVAWGQSIAWQFSGLSTYLIFPLFGLVAFSLMWSHFVSAGLRVYLKLDKAVLHTYFEVTSLAVLAAILLHPGLLAYQLWRDGGGLPPGSELHYVAHSLELYIVLAMVALTVFLVYELRRFYGTKPWWRFVQYASDAAILLIVLHSLKLGSNLQASWLRPIWYLYAISIVSSLAYMYYTKLTTPKPIEK